MLPTAILLPVFLHVLLVFALLIRTGSLRAQAARSGRVRLSEAALDGGKWPENTRKWANNYQNQFELPVLFYALVAFLLATNRADLVEVVLAWLFVVARLLHTAIHVTSNIVPRRGFVFLLGTIVLGAMWIWFGLRLYVLG